MALFTYKAIDQRGKSVLGQIEALNIIDLEMRLKRMSMDLVTGAPLKRGSSMMRAGSVSFVIKGREPAEIARHLDRNGIAVRAGHHCAQPILRRFGHEATVRPSVGLYNAPDDVECLVAALHSMD